MAAGNLDDPLSEIPNIVLVNQSAASAAPGVGFVRLEAVDGVMGVRVETGDWTPLAALIAGLLSSLTEKASPASGDWLLLQDTADSDELKKLDVDNLPGGTGGGLYDAYLWYTDEKAQNTAGGTFTSGDWRKRDLTNERADTAGIGSLASSQITLPAGTYRCLISCPAVSVDGHQARLYDTTGAATLITGQMAYAVSPGGGNGASPALIQGRFTLAQESVLEVQHRCTTTYATYGFGAPGNWTTEVYTAAEFWREA